MQYCRIAGCGKDQGLERSSHLRPPISDPPSQTPISSHHLRPPTSDPPPQTPHLRPQAPLLRPHAIRVRLQYQAPTMSVVTFFRARLPYQARTWHLQSQTPRFSCETTISGPEHDTYNLALCIGFYVQKCNDFISIKALVAINTFK